jgi:histidinol-phosphate/aromatic aminotransferase/cobyric acid decarboxylase-like protein
MKPIESLVRDNVRNLKPCVHGAEVYGAAEESGFRTEDILDFSSSVNPLGPSQKALDAITGAFGRIEAYPDSNSTALRQVLAEHLCNDISRWGLSYFSLISPLCTNSS